MTTYGSDVVRESGKRVGLTQQALADKAGTTQSAVARMESGRTKPAFEEAMRLVRLCGLDLDIMLVSATLPTWLRRNGCCRSHQLSG